MNNHIKQVARVNLNNNLSRVTTLPNIYKFGLNLDYPMGQCEYVHYEPILDCHTGFFDKATTP